MLNDFSVIFFNIFINIDLLIFMSVATKDNIVAIFGIIIPDPFVTPEIFIFFPDKEIVFEIFLTVVSVVSIDFENASQPLSDKFLFKLGNDSIIFLYFILSPIIPVEKTRISSILQFAIFAKTLLYLIISLNPSFPVPALALPELTIINLGLVFLNFSQKYL